MEERHVGDRMEWRAESLQTFRKDNEQNIGLREESQLFLIWELPINCNKEFQKRTSEGGRC